MVVLATLSCDEEESQRACRVPEVTCRPRPPAEIVAVVRAPEGPLPAALVALVAAASARTIARSKLLREWTVLCTAAAEASLSGASPP